MRPTHDELEFLISQYIDGTLNPVERAMVDEILATDVDARAMLAEYQSLHRVVKSSMPLPEIQWNEFAANICDETAKLDAPVKNYRLSFATWSRVAALAAVLAIVVGVIVELRPHTGSIAVTGPGKSVAVNNNPIDVEISAAPAIASAPVTQIQIGQPASFAAADDRDSDAVVSGPSSLWIASGSGSAQDNDPTLY